ncbi:hypothetical protein [Bacillus wiedmannii]|uniref:hypothetical protein n=1 Tax=Bacillus wiedmannii TaxID=1890302 RepID=UPI001245D428|nr:hypothetical protein [Bacillus wiedmannii]
MNIERLFNEEIRDKKRIGSNIFSRVSTRKGGGNQALRTPSYFMKGSNKYKKLSGDVEVYNLNDVISYQEFQVKNKSQQRMFMEAWKARYKAKDIQDKMGISKNVYYKILEDLGLPADSGRGRKAKNANLEELNVLSDEEMKKYMSDFIDFSEFKNIPRHQQITLLESYLKDFPVQSELAKVWGADLQFVYYISSVARKQRKKEREQRQEQNENNVSVIEENADDTIINIDEFKKLSEERQKELLIHWRSKYISADIKKGLGISEATLHGLISRLDIPRLHNRNTRKAVSTIQSEEVENVADTSSDNIEESSTSVTELAEPAKPIVENNGIDTQDIESQEDNTMEETRQNEENDNSLTIEIKGNYSTNAIMKSIQSILTTLEGEEEVVNIDLRVRKR